MTERYNAEFLVRFTANTSSFLLGSIDDDHSWFGHIMNIHRCTTCQLLEVYSGVQHEHIDWGKQVLIHDVTKSDAISD